MEKDTNNTEQKNNEQKGKGVIRRRSSHEPGVRATEVCHHVTCNPLPYNTQGEQTPTKE